MKIISIISIALAATVVQALPVVDELLSGEPEPFFNAQNDVRFLLFSRSNPTNGQPIIFRDLPSLQNSNYNRNLPTRVIIHGFQNDASSDVNIVLTAAFLRHSDVNVIVGEFQ